MVWVPDLAHVRFARRPALAMEAPIWMPVRCSAPDGHGRDPCRRPDRGPPATGMLSVQLAVPLSQALLWLHAHACSSGYPITDIAVAVVDRRLRVGHAAHDNGMPPTVADKD
jgi:hypothetical protein